MVLNSQHGSSLLIFLYSSSYNRWVNIVPDGRGVQKSHSGKHVSATRVASVGTLKTFTVGL